MAAAAAAQAVMMADGDRKDGQRVLLAVRLSAAEDNAAVTKVTRSHTVDTASDVSVCCLHGSLTLY